MTLEEKAMTRRDFMAKLVIGGGGAMVLLSGCSRITDTGSDQQSQKVYEFIAVDYTKCTGCRTCEAVCSAVNNPANVDGHRIPGLGNPALANIYVHSFNPDVSAPAICARCEDTPCVNACPVDPDEKTGHRALYRERQWGTIVVDAGRCISCGSCVDACNSESVGILTQHPETGRPMRMCTLCNGDPECVKQCPFEALSMIRVDADDSFYRMSPAEIAEKLNKAWYDIPA